MGHQNEKSKVRLNLEFTKGVKDTLDELQQRTESPTITEVFRRSLALLDMVSEHLQHGGSVVLRHKDGREEVLKFL